MADPFLAGRSGRNVLHPPGILLKKICQKWPFLDNLTENPHFSVRATIEMSGLHHEIRRFGKFGGQSKHFFKNFGPKVFWGEMGVLGQIVQKKAIFGLFFSKVCLVGATGQKWIGHAPSCSEIVESCSRTQ